MGSQWQININDNYTGFEGIFVMVIYLSMQHLHCQVKGVVKPFSLRFLWPITSLIASLFECALSLWGCQTEWFLIFSCTAFILNGSFQHAQLRITLKCGVLGIFRVISFLLLFWGKTAVVLLRTILIPLLQFLHHWKAPRLFYSASVFYLLFLPFCVTSIFNIRPKILKNNYKQVF